MATPAAYAVPPGVTAYDLATGIKLNIDELIYLLSPTDLPLTLGVDSQGTMVIGTDTVDQIQFSWQDEELLTPRTTLAAQATTGDLFITVAAGDRLKFSTGDIIRIMKPGITTTLEVMQVSGPGATADTLVVTRSFGASTATNYATSAVVVGIGRALAEGSNPENPRARDRDLRSNYTQIYGPEQVSMSRTEQKISKYGVTSEWNKQVWSRTREQYMAMEQSILFGFKFNDGTAKKRTSGGLDFFLTGNNLNSTATQLTAANIATAQGVAYGLGDVPLVLIANPASLIDLDDIGNTSVVRQMETDTRRGRVRVEVIDTEYGVTTIIRDRWCFTQSAYLVKPSGLTRRILSPMSYMNLAKTGDSDKGQIVAEEGLQVKGYQHMYRFNNLTAYAAA